MQTSPERLAIRMSARAAAKSAILAPVLTDVKLGQVGKPLGIVAPDATQRTAFEKDRSPHSVAVVLREFFYVKDSTFYHGIPFFRQ